MTIVRPFLRADLEASFDLWLAAWQTVLPPGEAVDLKPGWRRQFIDDLLPARIVLAAEAEGALAGFAVYDPAKAWLDQLVVDPARHRGGVGRMLFGAVEALAERRAFRFRVLKKNHGAIAFYDRLGCRQVGEAIAPVSGWPSWIYASPAG